MPAAESPAVSQPDRPRSRIPPRAARPRRVLRQAPLLAKPTAAAQIGENLGSLAAAGSASMSTLEGGDLVSTSAASIVNGEGSSSSEATGNTDTVGARAAGRPLLRVAVQPLAGGGRQLKGSCLCLPLLLHPCSSRRSGRHTGHRDRTRRHRARHRRLPARRQLRGRRPLT